MRMSCCSSIALACALATSACSSVPNVQPVAVSCPVPPPPPAWTMQKREPNLVQRLRSSWEELPATETAPSGN